MGWFWNERGYVHCESNDMDVMCKTVEICYSNCQQPRFSMHASFVAAGYHLLAVANGGGGG